RQAGQHGAVQLVAVERQHHLAVADITADDVEPFAERAIHEGAAIALSAFMLDAGGHLLREQADAAAAIERHAELAVRRCALEVAVEAGALVFACHDLARPGPFTLNLAEEALVLLGRKRGRSNQGGSRKRQECGQKCACDHRDTRLQLDWDSEVNHGEEWLTLRLPASARRMVEGAKGRKFIRCFWFPVRSSCAQKS